MIYQLYVVLGKPVSLKYCVIYYISSLGFIFVWMFLVAPYQWYSSVLQYLQIFKDTSDISRQNLGIVVLEKQAGIWGVLWAFSGSRAENWWGSRKLCSFSYWNYFLYFKFSHIYDTHNSMSIMKLCKSKTN